jgi:mono/diheme cytochrome c family protein
MKSLAAILTAFLTAVLLAGSGFAQGPQGAEEGHNAPTFKPGKNLTDQQKRGEYLFLQRCQICHLAKYRKSIEVSERPAVYRNLEGVLKDGGAARETLVREQIRRGSLNMPGFQYGLEAREIEDIIAYLKTR